jgi:hypothetical protein
MHESAETLERKLVDFRPQFPMEDWEPIRTFVVDAVRESAPLLPYPPRALVSNCAAHVRWAWRDAGHPLDRKIVFNVFVIEESIESRKAGLASGTVGNLRAELIAMARILLPNDLALVRLTPLYKSTPIAPYSEAEIANLCSWARGQNTTRRRHDAAVMVYAGLGAGLKDAELRELRVQDVVIDEEGVMLFVRGPHERVVPVLHRWEDRFAEFVDYVGGPDRYLFRPNVRRTGQLVSGSFVAYSTRTAVQPTLQRMRVTWIVHHLASQTPLPGLMLAAGITSLESMRRYMRYLPNPAAEEFRRHLRKVPT